MQNNFFFKGKFSNVYKKPSILSGVTSQILYGEKFKILSNNKSWIKIKLAYDNYIGFIKNAQYIKKFKPKYKVSNLKTKIYKKPYSSSKSWLTFGSKLSCIDENKDFIKIENNKWVKKKDVKRIDYKEKNFIKIFEKFIGVKYTWGGKTFKGIDCSALLQIYFYYNNIFFPRDTKDQIKFLKKKFKKRKFKKGDILFWKGHVAICLNSRNLIHAYGPKKKVLIMPINKTVNKIQESAKLKLKKISYI